MASEKKQLKWNKTEVMLLLYDTFREKRDLIKKHFMAETGISDVTFRRYMRDLHHYLAKHQPNAKIVYNRGGKIYYYKKKRAPSRL